MKSRVIVIHNIKIKIILFITIIFIGFLVINMDNNKSKNNIQSENSKKETAKASIEYNKINNTTNTTINKPNNIKENKIDFPEEVDGYKVIGKLEIPKIELTTYILSETSKDSLNKSVTKLCGPKINGIGNVCITGHNYNKKNMFSHLNELENGDRIFVTDTKGNKVEYLVYDKYKVYPKETECLSQETEGEREITLITCTTGAIKRLIIKAVELYD